MISELAVNFAQGRVESRATEIGVDGWVAAQKLAHVSVLNLLKVLVAAAVRGGRLRLIRARLRGLLHAACGSDEQGHRE